jgi:hypothetical protein
MSTAAITSEGPEHQLGELHPVLRLPRLRLVAPFFVPFHWSYVVGGGPLYVRMWG